jgi:hypothetical protein
MSIVISKTHQEPAVETGLAQNSRHPQNVMATFDALATSLKFGLGGTKWDSYKHSFFSCAPLKLLGAIPDN